MFDARPDGKKQFTPMDIIPIINTIFPDFVRRAIAE
jgi:hypothetical protein